MRGGEHITIDDSHGNVKVRYVNPSVDAEPSTPSDCDGIDEYPADSCGPPSHDERLGGDEDVTAETPAEALYEGSNGRYYTEWQLRTRLRTGRWKPCIRQRDPDRRLVATADGSLVLLTPTDDLPPWAELRIEDRGVRVVDTRRPVPSGSLPR